MGLHDLLCPTTHRGALGTVDPRTDTQVPAQAQHVEGDEHEQGHAVAPVQADHPHHRGDDPEGDTGEHGDHHRDGLGDLGDDVLPQFGEHRVVHLAGEHGRRRGAQRPDHRRGEHQSAGPPDGGDRGRALLHGVDQLSDDDRDDQTAGGTDHAQDEYRDQHRDVATSQFLEHPPGVPAGRDRQAGASCPSRTSTTRSQAPSSAGEDATSTVVHPVRTPAIREAMACSVTESTAVVGSCRTSTGASAPRARASARR